MKETIRLLRARLRPVYGAGESEAMIRMIFGRLKGWRPVDIVLHEDEELTPYMRRKIEEILARLMKHEPLQYILGTARFYGLDLKVTPDVLIPRPETEELVEIVLRSLGSREDLHVLDACTGSGCIAVALARNLRFPHVTAFDVSEPALAVARENAEALKVKVTFCRADALRLSPDTLPGAPWDAIVSNPPYIGGMEKASMEPNVLDYEPHSALFVPEKEPLLFYEALGRYAMKTLREGAGIYFEINPLHAEELESMMRGLGFEHTELIRDMSGKLRFFTARKPMTDTAL